MKKLALMLCLVVIALPALAQEEAEKPAKKREPGLYATLDTTMGKIVMKLYDKEAPKTVANFVDLAIGKKQWRDSKTGQAVIGKPLFDGVIFHRVMEGFMSQSGGQLPDGSSRVAAEILDEFGPGLKFDRPGRVAMANRGPNTGSSQFFITHVPVPRLDGGYPIFGQVVEGLTVVTDMAKVELLLNERGERAVPAKPILINKVTLERIPSGSETK